MQFKTCEELHIKAECMTKTLWTSKKLAITPKCLEGLRRKYSRAFSSFSFFASLTQPIGKSSLCSSLLVESGLGTVQSCSMVGPCSEMMTRILMCLDTRRLFSRIHHMRFSQAPRRLRPYLHTYGPNGVI